MNITEEMNQLESSEEHSIYEFEYFIEDCWDYVSGDVVDDKYYEKNKTFLRELTFDLYTLYDCENKLTYQEQQKSAKEVGKLLEIFFSNLLKN